MIEGLLLLGVACAGVGATLGLILNLRKPNSDTSWRKQPPPLGKINYDHNTVDHLGRKEPTLR
jgi:hypothetical protein